MSNPFYDHPIINSPYEKPSTHWELDDGGQPTQTILGSRRKAEFVTPIPKPKRPGRNKSSPFVFDEGHGLSNDDQQYETTSNINAVRARVDQWRALPKSQQQVTPETARLLEHWRHHTFSSYRPFFCQVEAAEPREPIPIRRPFRRIPRNAEDGRRKRCSAYRFRSFC